MQKMPIQNLLSEVPLPGTVTVEPGDALVIAFYTIVVAFSAELFYRCLAGKIDKNNRLIRFFKGLMAMFFFIKAIIFMTFNTAIFINCNPSVRTADLCYQLAVTAGVCVLLIRLKAVLPVGIRSHMSSFHIGIVFFRLAIGIIDVILIDFDAPDPSLCIYLESSAWGPVYTFYDTAIDLYVTLMIAFFLSKHIYRLHRTGTQGNISTYIGIVVQNIIRTTILTVVNLISAVFIIQKITSYGIVVLWPVVNVLFVLLIGYDADLAQAMRHLHYSVFNERLPCTNASPTVHPGGGGGGSDPFATVPSPCPYCGHRPSTDQSTPTIRGIWQEPRSRQPPVSRTPSFLATTTTSNSLYTDASEATTTHSPGYRSALQTSFNEGSILDGSLHRTSNDYMASTIYSDNLLSPLKTLSSSPSLNRQKCTSGESSKYSYPQQHPCSAPSTPTRSMQEQRKLNKDTPNSSL
ncbi:hypothetical protein BDA99DRAFT_508253 [Phascolomyces articulosus]|uniref:Uncharacterized protein n=1 Tax=Phascolomyces articulosus TaxID=60185 RepID=A0AAD5K0N9_9FUNG|nr:hypothetical protein BDA99DRAFT_508253 [Phascolomyces articulosus]